MGRFLVSGAEVSMNQQCKAKGGIFVAYDILERTERTRWEALKFIADIFMGRQSGPPQTAN
jgi:hypothetical protein